MTVETVTEDERWMRADLPALADAAVCAVLRKAAPRGTDWEVSVLGCSDNRIAMLNAEFRGKPSPTNVLSWPSEERAADRPGAKPRPPSPMDTELGDIAIAYETCVREADTVGIPIVDHVTHLLVHGTLHLLGYDHETDEDAALMERLEVETLATLGVANPY